MDSGLAGGQSLAGWPLHARVPGVRQGKKKVPGSISTYPGWLDGNETYAEAEPAK
jgi:hypothetical protein